MGPTFISNISLSCWMELDRMLDANFNLLKRPFNIHIQHYFSPLSIHSFIFKVVTHKDAAVRIFKKLVDSDDEKPPQGKTRERIKRRRESGYFQNIFYEIKVENPMGFKDMFHLSVTDYEFLLSQISNLISPNERITKNKHILADK